MNINISATSGTDVEEGGRGPLEPPNFMAVAVVAVAALLLLHFDEHRRFTAFRSLYPLCSPSSHHSLPRLLPLSRPLWPRQQKHVTHRQMGTRTVRPFSSLFDRPLTCLAFTVLLLLSTRPNFRLTAPSLQIPLPPLDTKLSILRQTLSEHTHLPPNAFKLIYAGAVMKDDDAPRKSFLPMIIRHFRLPLPSTPDSAVFPHSSVPHHSLLVNCLQSHV